MLTAKVEFDTVNDSDDWSHPQKLERQMRELLETSQLMAVGSDWVRVTTDMCCVGPWLPSEKFVEPNVSAGIFRRVVLDVRAWRAKGNVAAGAEFLWRLRH